MIGVTYICRCMQVPASLRIGARPAGQDVNDWLDKVVAPAIKSDHRHRSATCEAM